MNRGRSGVWSRVLAIGVVAVLALAPTGVAGAATSPDGAARPGDPALSVDPGTVLSTMVCRGPVDGGGREPVLLVHGTFVTGAENFGWNYLPELAALGYRVCTVDLPNRSIDDIQVAAEYVVVAVHRLARETGRRVDVLGHSQGVLQSRWAVRWWPSVRAEVDDLVSLAGPNQGTTVAANPVSSLVCPACVQMAPGSNFIAALNAGDQTPGDVSYTAIYSTLLDELIMPNATAARIEGAANVELQALCPARVVTHVTILVDAVAFALALDALRSPGPASVARFDRATCLRTTTLGVPSALSGLQALFFPPLPTVGAIPAAEPPLKPYARPTPASTTTTTRAASRPRSAAAVTAGPAQASASASVAQPAAPSRTGPPAAAPRPEAPAALPASTTAATRPVDRGPGPLLPLLAVALAAGAVGGATARRLRRP